MFEKIKNILVEELGKDPDSITEDSDIRNDLGITSLELIETIMVFEETFDITIDEEKLSDIKTVGDIVKHIEELKK